MKRKSQRIKTIVDLKVTQEKNTLEGLGSAQKKVLAIQVQMESLWRYRQEYQDRFIELGYSGISVAQLLEFRSFMGKLDKAIASQDHALEKSQTDLLVKKKAWEKAHHDTKSLQKVCHAVLADEIKQERKFEQLEQDERWSRRAKLNGAKTYYAKKIC